MSSDDAVRHASEPTLIRTPDQLQQSKRADAPAVGAVADQQSEARKASDQSRGILGQLETERAHD